MSRGWRFRQIARLNGAETRLFGPRWAGSASPAGQGDQTTGQGSGPSNPLKNNPGQAGQGGEGSETAANENTHTHEEETPGEGQSQIARRAHGPRIYPDHPDHPDQASNHAGFTRSGHGQPAQTSLTSWTELDAWCARLGAAGARANRIPILHAWVAAAGGWSEAGAIHIPEAVPNGLALATLKAHARGLGLTVHVDPDSPELLDWLRAAP